MARWNSCRRSAGAAACITGSCFFFMNVWVEAFTRALRASPLCDNIGAMSEGMGGIVREG